MASSEKHNNDTSLTEQDERLPEWAPKGGGKGFACRVQDGVTARHDGSISKGVDLSFGKSGSGTDQGSGNGSVTPSPVRRPALSPEQMAEALLSGNRMILARAITLVESNAPRHADKAQELIRLLLPHSGRAMRIGITGVPGVGKSTFIEALGGYLTGRGHRVAVLAVDPSSSISGGSILGDKTRMETLCQDPNCFIRPSPSSGSLGGVARKTRETMLVCEAAGFDVILIETVGVGQSEVTVRSMVDFFLLLMLAGAGDELQGIKKGIMEIANALVINKADGENKLSAERAKAEYERALHYLQPATQGWTTHAYTCSAVTGDGIQDIWDTIKTFKKITQESGVFEQFRQEQTVKWVHDMVQDHLTQRFFKHQEIKERLPEIEADVAGGRLPPVTAVRQLLKIFNDSGGI